MAVNDGAFPLALTIGSSRGGWHFSVLRSCPAGERGQCPCCVCGGARWRMWQRPAKGTGSWSGLYTAHSTSCDMKRIFVCPPLSSPPFLRWVTFSGLEAEHHPNRLKNGLCFHPHAFLINLSLSLFSLMLPFFMICLFIFLFSPLSCLSFFFSPF